MQTEFFFDLIYLIMVRTEGLTVVAKKAREMVDSYRCFPGQYS